MRDEHISGSPGHNYSRLPVESMQRGLSPISDLDVPMHSCDENPSPAPKDTSASATKEAGHSFTQMAHSTRTLRETGFGWWWEVVSVVVSLACTAAIIGILFSMDDKPLSDWKLNVHGTIKPNSLIALIDRIAVTALLFPLAQCLGQLKWAYFEHQARPVNHMQTFDGASRGPWGSLLFLWEIKGKSILATLGAILVILSLVFDVFTQQAIGYPIRGHQFHNKTGSIHVGSNWLNGYSGSKVNTTDQNVYIPLTAGIMTVLGDQDYSPSPNYNCPTSDCQLQDVNTLAICSTCGMQTIDSTQFDRYAGKISERMTNEDQTEKDFTFDTYQDLNDYLSQLPEVEPDYDMQHPNVSCVKENGGFPRISLELQSVSDTSTRASLFTQPDGVYTKIQEVMLPNDKTTSDPGKKDTDSVPNATLRYCVYANSSIGSTSLIKASCFSSTTDLSLYKDIRKVGQINGTIHSCELSLCEQHYDSVSILRGVKTTNGTKTSPLSLPPPLYEGYTTNHLNMTANAGSQKLYQLDTFAVEELRTAFLHQANSFEGNIGHVFGKVTTLANGTALDDFPKMFNRFADVLTSIIQSSGNPDGELVQMDVYDSDVFMEVNWLWMIMPFCITFFSIVVLALSIWESRKEEYLLKTSILAVMYHGLDSKDWRDGFGSGLGEGVQRRARDSELVERSKSVEAIFEHDEGGRMKLKTS